MRKSFPPLEILGIQYKTSHTRRSRRGDLARIIRHGPFDANSGAELGCFRSTLEDNFNQIADGGAHLVRDQHTSDQVKPKP